MNENMNNNPFNNGVPTGQTPVQNPSVTNPVPEVPVEQPAQTPVQSEVPVTPIQNPTQVEPVSTSNVEIPNQGINQSVPSQTPKKSKKGLIIGLTAGIVAIGAIVACLFLFVFNGGSDPKSIVKAYVNNLIDKKYGDNYELVYIPENSFVTKDDYLTFVQTKDAYENINKYKIENIEEKLIKENDATYTVTLSNDSILNIDLSVKLKKDKEKWKVEENNFYLSNWTVVIPGGTELYIDDVKVDKSLYSENKERKEKLDVKIPAIYSQEKEFKLVNPLETKTLKVTPLSSNNNAEILVELTDQDLIQKAYNYIKNTWNEMYAAYLNGVDVSEIASKYFDSSMSIESVNAYYKAAFDSITAGTSGYKYVNYSLLEVVNGKDSNYIIDKDKITLNFGYKLSWNWEFSFDNGIRTMTRYSKIRLVLDGDSFKIYQVPDDKFFTWTNSFTHEY